jgi:hypothetical protein
MADEKMRNLAAPCIVIAIASRSCNRENSVKEA